MLRTTRSPESEISTAPMSDIAFQLLIFFMVTATFVAARGLDFGVPEEVEAVEVDPVDSIHVVVRSSGDLLIDKKPVSIHNLLDVIAGKIANNTNKPVILETEAKAPYGSMVEAYDLLRQAKERLALADELEIYVPTLREKEVLWQ